MPRTRGGKKRELTVLQIRQAAFRSAGIDEANRLQPGSYNKPGSNNRHKQA